MDSWKRFWYQDGQPSPTRQRANEFTPADKRDPIHEPKNIPEQLCLWSMLLRRRRPPGAGRRNRCRDQGS